MLASLPYKLGLMAAAGVGILVGMWVDRRSVSSPIGVESPGDGL
jgi:hypothetical protein